MECRSSSARRAPKSECRSSFAGTRQYRGTLCVLTRQSPQRDVVYRSVLTMNNEVASALRGLYTKFGDQILTQPPRLASLLRDECPERRPEISALVKALEEQVPQDLLNCHSGEPPRSLAARLSKRLSEEHLLARDASSWAVWAWAHGLGLGDEYRNDTEEQTVTRSALIDPMSPQQVLTDPMSVPIGVPAVSRVPWPKWIAIAAIVMILAAVVAQHTIFRIPPPPHIASIDVPKRIRVGKPYAFEVRFDTAKAGVVSIERRVLQSDVKWAQETTHFKVSGMEQQSQGTIQYAFEPETRPSKSTVQFVLIDRNGQRSPPQTVSYEVLPAPVVCNLCGTISDIQKIEERRQPRGIGAVTGAVIGGLLGSTVGKGRGKKAATAAGAVGGGIAGNAIEGRMISAHWEVTVRLKNGRKHIVQMATEPGWQVGQSVKLVDGEIVPL
jgi:outer membrane lipoprotein SlyB